MLAKPFRLAILLLGYASSLTNGALGGSDKIKCLWTVNDHNNFGLYEQLSPALRSGLSAKTTSLYPAGSVRLSGFVDYPTELFTLLPSAMATTAARGSCATVRNGTGAYESSFGHVAAASIEDCCSACSATAQCKFALYQAHNPLPTHHCWLCNATTLTPRPQRDTQLVTVPNHLAPPPPPAVYWQTAWEHNIAAMPAAMARWTLAGLNATTEGLLMVDYEPAYRPSWRFPNPNGTAQPRWEEFLATVHADAIDTNFTSLVGWSVPATASDWSSLTKHQQDQLQMVSWDYFCRQYLTAGLRAINAALPAKVELSFWSEELSFLFFSSGQLSVVRSLRLAAVVFLPLQQNF